MNMPYELANNPSRAELMALIQLSRYRLLDFDYWITCLNERPLPTELQALAPLLIAITSQSPVFEIDFSTMVRLSQERLDKIAELDRKNQLNYYLATPQ